MKISKIDFKYCVLYDYNTHYDCEANGCDSICRCGVIQNANVISVDITQMVVAITDRYFDKSLSAIRNSKINSLIGNVTSEIDFYTIDRILRINEVYKPSNWDIQIFNGYYGEEINEIILDNSLAIKIENQLEEAFNITGLKERIEYLLTLEYGYILPDLKGRSYQVATIEKSKIIFGSDNQYYKVSNDKLEHYSDNKYLTYRGIVTPKGNEYRLIDGYHRCFASKDKFIEVIVAS